jgi:hypothetical protein
MFFSPQSRKITPVKSSGQAFFSPGEQAKTGRHQYGFTPALAGFAGGPGGIQSI